MTKGMPVKTASQKLFEAIHRVEPEAAFAVEFWDGTFMKFGDSPQVTLHFRTEASARETLTLGFLGFGEAFTDGTIEVTGNLQELLRLGYSVRFAQRNLPLLPKLRFLLEHLRNSNTRGRSRHNIAHHYDRGDDFYRLFLDPTLTYSSAYFRTPEDTLEEAQRNKYEHIARKLLLKRGERLLDIGCGWGGMIFFAARQFGVHALGNTLSRNQYEYVRGEIQRCGLSDQVAVLYTDYRNLEGRFDKVVSIGMFEHVGRRFIPTFMKKVAHLLRQGGLGLLHTIGKELDAAPDPWIRRHIFPGGYIPTLHEIVHHLAKAGLSVLDVENLRMHYARTLDLWIRNFERNEERIRDMLGERFVRMWRLFLNASSAEFKYGDNRLYQVLFSKGPNNELPLTRSHLYVDSGSGRLGSCP